MTSPLRIALVGTGNVASRLAPLILADAGFEICLVASRSVENARRLAEKLGPDVAFTDNLAHVATIRPDIVLISVADNAIEDVIKAIGPIDNQPLVIHTSGTVSRSVLEPVSPRTAVLYPLQTFTKGREVDIRRVPVFTEAASDLDHSLLDRLAAAVSTRVEHTDPGRRKALHIAGVITNNFTNILLEQVEKILNADGYALDVVRPLIDETIAKAFEIGPHAAQTGPARRGDRAVISEHIAAIPDDLKDIYASLSELIIKSHHE